jgi:mannose-6-phosphate isomerase class I
MSQLSKKPYLVIPKLIQQPTWGGTYILHLKNWLNNPILKNKKIGQSYELYGNSKLALSITDSRDKQFIPEIGFADKPDILTDLFQLQDHTDYLTLSEVASEEKEAFLGKHVYEKYGKMPLLNKINHSAGNSFQVHIKSTQTHSRWQAKPESWYYFEDGYISCGVKPTTNIDEYKKVCNVINEKMKELSSKIISAELSLEEAKSEAKTFIKQQNPWQFVNLHEVKKHEIIDLSLGGIHHSWEEDKEKFPDGNRLYEVQVDVMDPLCTIRAFDQGKIKDDGSIRELHIDDYFQFLDTNPELNDIASLKKQRNGNNLVKTPFYSLDIVELNGTFQDTTKDSFVHLYIRDGEVDITTSDGKVHVEKGHSCFIPYDAHSYTITSTTDSVMLKTYIEN